MEEGTIDESWSGLAIFYSQLLMCIIVYMTIMKELNFYTVPVKNKYGKYPAKTYKLATNQYSKYEI